MKPVSHPILAILLWRNWETRFSKKEVRKSCGFDSHREYNRVIGPVAQLVISFFCVDIG